MLRITSGVALQIETAAATFKCHSRASLRCLTCATVPSSCLEVLCMAVLRMSTEELSRVETLVQVASGRLTVTEAARIMGITRRHAHRLLTRFMDDGSSGLISRRRGRPSNRRMDDAIRTRIVALVREHYYDFTSMPMSRRDARFNQPWSAPAVRRWSAGAGRSPAAASAQPVRPGLDHKPPERNRSR